MSAQSLSENLTGGSSPFACPLIRPHNPHNRPMIPLPLTNSHSQPLKLHTCIMRRASIEAHLGALLHLLFGYVAKRQHFGLLIVFFKFFNSLTEQSRFKF